MNYGKILKNDIANGPGCRTTLFVSGCTHQCPGCFNEATWDFAYGSPFTKEVEDSIIESLKPAYIKGLTLLGGEPMEPGNQKVLRPFLTRVREEVPKADIWVYSGFTFEELTNESYQRAHTEDTLPMLQLCDVLVDGRFVLALKDFSLKFRGSSNQRIIDLTRTFAKGRIVISEYEKRT